MSTRIHSIKLSVAPPTREMYLHPWTVTSQNFQDNDHLLGMLAESTADGTNLTANALAPVANSLLVPDARTQRQAGIVGGYGEKRFAVEIIVETVNSQMMSTYEVITGYTSHYGFTDAQGKPLLDDEMMLVINGVCDLHHENYGDGSIWRVNNVTQVLSPVTSSTVMSDPSSDFGIGHVESVVDDQMVSCRPTDTLAVMATGVMSEHGAKTTVNSFMLSTGNKRGSRANNLAANYLSNTATAYRNQMLDDSMDDAALLAASASPLVNDPAMTATSFLRELRKHTQYNQERAIYWKELRQVDPSLRPDDVRITVVPGTQKLLDTARAQMESSEYWNSAYHETMVAQQLAWAMPAFMSQRNIGHIEIEAHNATIGNQVVVNIYTVSSTHAEIDVSKQLEKLKQSFAASVFHQLSGSLPGRTLYVRINCGLIGVANMVIEIDGQGKRPHNAPVFNDAAWSPQLAGGYQQLHGLADDLGKICTALTNSALTSQADFAQLVTTHDGVGTRGATAPQPATNPLSPTIAPLPTLAPKGPFGGGNGGGLGF